MNKTTPLDVLVVEDDGSLNHLMCDHLTEMGLAATGVHTGAEARAAMALVPPDLILLDMRLPDCDGFSLLPEFAPISPVIVVTAYATVDQAVKAVHAGASDYLTKPIGFEHLDLVVRRVMATQELKRDVQYWQGQAKRVTNMAIVGSSPEIEEVRGLIGLYANAESCVLIEGESGVGKELVARAIHDTSERAPGRFVPIDCDPSQENLLASELFGHEQGAFPGADTRREGMLEFADKGTLYLSDIAEVSLALQSKVLRVIETGKFRRLGGAQDVSTDVRIIFGTSRDLAQMVADESFRSELFYQLSAFRLHVPALRERSGDVAELADHFLNTRSFHRGIEKILPRATLSALEAYDWPGNVRELSNAIERGLIMSGESREVNPEDIGMAMPGNGAKSGECGGVRLSFDDLPTLEAMRDTYLAQMLERFDGNRSKVARILGISERNLYRLVRKLEQSVEGRS
jgi:two-component system NtrC family response regulator